MSTTPIEVLAAEEMESIGKSIHNNLKARDDRFDFTTIEYTQFANGEIKPKIPNTVRHKDTYIIHSMFHPDPNTSLVKLLLTVDAVSRASADSISLVLPYMSYTRQDRKDEPRVPISARVVADVLQTNPKVERILTMDLHCDQVQGFYHIPVDNLYGSLVHKEHFKEKYGGDYSNLVVVSPDHGGVVRARRFAKSLDEDVPVYIIDKRRSGPNKVEVMHFIGGDLANKDVVIYDDMIDTGGSIRGAAKVAKERGANDVYAVATHGIFSNNAEEQFAKSDLQVIVTESIPRSAAYKSTHKEWLTVLPIDGLVSEALYQSATVGGSVSTLFER